MTVGGCERLLKWLGRDVFKRNDKMYDLEFGGGADKWLDSRNFRLVLVFWEFWSFKLASS
jgi:hypothetical protein